MELQKLGLLLKKAEELPLNGDFYLQGDSPWSGDSMGAVLVTDPYEVDEVPDFAKIHDLRLTLSVSDVQDIISNVKQQVPTVSIEQIVKAFNYYFKRDAFIDFL